MNIWLCLICLGEVITIFLGDMLLHYLDSTWQVFLIIFCLLLFFSGLLFYCCLDEIPIEYEDEGTLCEMVDEKWTIMKGILTNPNQTLVIIETSLFVSLYYTSILWLPYFFSVLGFEFYANKIGLTVPLVSIVAPILF